jgi:hypothetical protein
VSAPVASGPTGATASASTASRDHNRADAPAGSGNAAGPGALSREHAPAPRSVQ